MSMTSLDYFLLVGALLGALLLARVSVRRDNLLLLLASYAFYAAFDRTFPLVLLFITLAVYAAARLNARSETHQRLWLGLGLLASLGTLGLFKYYDFFVTSFGGSPALRLVLPVGLSFYTFQAISYLLDVHNRRIPAVHNLLSFGLYMAFFPRLLAGPIERAETFLPQIENQRQITGEKIERGLFLILQGVFKKLAVANIIGLAIGDYLGAAGFFDQIPAALLWVVLFLYTLQIYLDFAGYMDIARGTGMLLGFQLSRNFAAPYFAPRPVEFWNRWHITLSNWLRDYLFLPTSRFLLRRHINRVLVLALAYLVTMGISGLWHGAGWNFLVWGLLHGVMLFIGRQFMPLRPLQTPADYLLRAGETALTFLLVNLTFVFFALPVPDALEFLGRLFSFEGGSIAPLGTPLLYAVFCWLLFDLSELFIDADKLAIMRLPAPLRGMVYALMLAAAVVSGLSYVQQFVYEAF